MAVPETETLKSRIRNFVNDVATLDVITLTGDITLVANQYDPVAKKFNWDDLFSSIAAKMKAADASKLEIVAYTHAEWDLDSVNFVRKDLSDGDKDLLAAHNAAVEAAQKSRFEAVKVVAGLLGVKF
jgi:hypothetical protein